MSKNDVFSAEYNDKRDGGTKATTPEQPVVELKIDVKTYGVSKPKRIIRRARLVND